ncbi:hypothetical protein HDK64DRAFT_282539 [Phyllosticta capitalensis]
MLQPRRLHRSCPRHAVALELPLLVLHCLNHLLEAHCVLAAGQHCRVALGISLFPWRCHRRLALWMLLFPSRCHRLVALGMPCPLRCHHRVALGMSFFPLRCHRPTLGLEQSLVGAERPQQPQVHQMMEYFGELLEPDEMSLPRIETAP